SCLRSHGGERSRVIGVCIMIPTTKKSYPKRFCSSTSRDTRHAEARTAGQALKARLTLQLRMPSGQDPTHSSTANRPLWQRCANYCRDSQAFGRDCSEKRRREGRSTKLSATVKEAVADAKVEISQEEAAQAGAGAPGPRTCQAAVLNSLTSASQRTYDHAI